MLQNQDEPQVKVRLAVIILERLTLIRNPKPTAPAIAMPPPPTLWLILGSEERPIFKRQPALSLLLLVNDLENPSVRTLIFIS
jgi:hypothetical protein